MNLPIRIAQSLSAATLFLSFCAAHAQTPIQLDVDASPLARHYATYGGVSKSFSITYTGGPRYPHLERIPGKPDTLESLFTPLR